MNYTKAPNAPPAGLTYPILQETIDLSNADFTKLFTTPLVLLPNQSNNICPINITLQYNCSLINTGLNIYIGFEAYLNSNIASALAFYDTGGLLGGTQKLTLAINYRSYVLIPSNTNDFQPLVLWQQADDPSATFLKFIMTITYMRILNL